MASWFILALFSVIAVVALRTHGLPDDSLELSNDENDSVDSSASLRQVLSRMEKRKPSWSGNAWQGNGGGGSGSGGYRKFKDDAEARKFRGNFVEKEDAFHPAKLRYLQGRSV